MKAGLATTACSSLPISSPYSVAAPTTILTGFMQGPAISNRLGWFGKVLNRQRARSIHFIAMWWFLLFILIHVTLVFITGARSI